MPKQLCTSLLGDVSGDSHVSIKSTPETFASLATTQKDLRVKHRHLGPAWSIVGESPYPSYYPLPSLMTIS